MTTPAGEACKLTYRWKGKLGKEPRKGDVLKTGTGRRYLILEVGGGAREPVEVKGKILNRWIGAMHFKVLVMFEDDPTPDAVDVGTDQPEPVEPSTADRLDTVATEPEPFLGTLDTDRPDLTEWTQREWLLHLRTRSTVTLAQATQQAITLAKAAGHEPGQTIVGNPAILEALYDWTLADEADR